MSLWDSYDARRDTSLPRGERLAHARANQQRDCTCGLPVSKCDGSRHGPASGRNLTLREEMARRGIKVNNARGSFSAGRRKNTSFTRDTKNRFGGSWRDR